jgi:hypothetical protein
MYMTKARYQEYLKTAHWLQLRELKLAQQPYCEYCRSPYRLHIHHRVYDLYHEQLEDLQTLCNDCHERKHKGHCTIKRKGSARCADCWRYDATSYTCNPLLGAKLIPRYIHPDAVCWMWKQSTTRKS